MNILIKQARIADPSSPFNGQTTDIFIEDGVIRGIDQVIETATDQTITLPGLHVSPGWVDTFAHFGDPGQEFKETLETGAAAAAAGGFTDVLLLPNTNPPVHNKSAVEYLVQKGRSLPIHIHPIGAITRNAEGKELAEMYDMKASGAVAFSDGIHSIQSAGLLVKALQYVKAFGGTLIQLPDDKSINPLGLMNEGIVSTRMGLMGKPSMAEELIVARDIELCLYAASRLHFTGISTGKSLDHIRRGKKENTGISCAVTPHHLFFTDEDLAGYDTHLKVNPPIRTAEERAALQHAIADGTIDCIATHHLPHEYDSKMVEFEYAKDGMIGLETAFAAINTAVAGTDPSRWTELLSINPRKLFGLAPVTIDKGLPASLTLFDPRQKWTPAVKDLRSKSRNSPFIGKELVGKVIGIIHKNALVLN